MVKQAVWNGAVLAESDDTVVMEGHHYFPVESLRSEHFSTSRFHSLCYWKGVASYYHVTVDGMVNKRAAWYYPHPWPLARKIKNRVAFWYDITIIDPDG